MGAGAAVLAAAQRRVAAVAPLFPAPTTPTAESVASEIDTPALILAGVSDIDSLNSNAVPLAAAWSGPAILRTLEGAGPNGLAEGRRLLAALGGGKHEPKTARATRALLTGYLLHTLLGDKTYAAFSDPETSIRHTHVIDPAAALHDQEETRRAAATPDPATVGKLVRTLRK